MALVCLCNGVSERMVARAIGCGAGTVEEIGEACGAGTTCHGCHPTLEALLDEQPVMVAARTAVA